MLTNAEKSMPQLPNPCFRGNFKDSNKVIWRGEDTIVI